MAEEFSAEEIEGLGALGKFFKRATQAARPKSRPLGLPYPVAASLPLAAGASGTLTIQIEQDLLCVAIQLYSLTGMVSVISPGVQIQGGNQLVLAVPNGTVWYPPDVSQIALPWTAREFKTPMTLERGRQVVLNLTNNDAANAEVLSVILECYLRRG